MTDRRTKKTHSFDSKRLGAYSRSNDPLGEEAKLERNIEHIRRLIKPRNPTPGAADPSDPQSHERGSNAPLGEEANPPRAIELLRRVIKPHHESASDWSREELKLIRLRLTQKSKYYRKYQALERQLETMSSLEQKERLLQLANYEDNSLREPWDDKGVITVAFSEILNASSVMNVMRLFNEWEYYFNGLTAAFEKAHVNMTKTLESDQDRRKEVRKRNIQIAMGVFSVALGAFGLSPVASILSAVVNEKLNSSGFSAFGERPGLAEIKSPETQPQLQLLRDEHTIGYGGEDWTRSLINEGTAAAAKGYGAFAFNQASSRITGMLEERLGARLPPSLSEESFLDLLKGIKDAFTDIKVATENHFVGVLEKLKAPQRCLPYARKIVLQSIRTGAFNGNDLDNISHYVLTWIVTPLRTKLEKELIETFRCPMDAPFSVDAVEIERMMWAHYFSTNLSGTSQDAGKSGLVKNKHKFAFDKDDIDKLDLQDMEGTITLSNIIGNRLVKIGIAKHRDYTDHLFKFDAKKKRKEEVKDMLLKDEKVMSALEPLLFLLLAYHVNLDIFLFLIIEP